MMVGAGTLSNGANQLFGLTDMPATVTLMVRSYRVFCRASWH
jgi:hypothetical protein